MSGPNSPRGRLSERPERYYPSLDGAFDAAIAPYRTGSDPIAVLFSGGVDSVVLAGELRGRGSVELTTTGVAGAPDLLAASSAAAQLGLPWRGSILSVDDLEQGRARWTVGLSPMPRSRQSIHLALALAIEHAPAGTILCGQGPDELFLGYAHFQSLGPDAATRRATEDLDRLLREDWPRTVDLGRRMGREVVAPFLDGRFVRAATEIPIVDRLPDPRPKGLWRDWARHRGVPAELADRPKRALQYGSGVDRWLRRQAVD